MEQRLTTLPAVTVAYMRQVGPYGPKIMSLWMKFHNWAKPLGIWNPSVITYGISHDSPMDTPPEKCRYDACIEVPGDFKFDDNVQRADLPGGEYATLAFYGKGPEIGAAFGRVLHEVIPQLGKQPDFSRPVFERYVVGEEMDADGRFKCDICVPVK